MTAKTRAPRDLLGIAAPALWLALTLAPMIGLWDRLPEPMAVHWGTSGEPDGAMSRAAALGFFAFMTGAAGLIAFRVTRRAPAPPRTIAPGLTVATFVGLFGAIIEWIVIRLNLDAASWREAGALPWSWLALPLVAAAAAAAVTHRLATRLETAAADDDAGTLPSIGLAATERAIWCASAGNPWIATLALGLAGAGAAVFFAGEPAGILAAAFGGVLGLFAVVRVHVDQRGLTVTYGPLGLPRQRVPLAHIRSARVVRVVPMRQGGWGYRGSRLLFRRASIIVRAGPGIELDCGARGQLIITVDDGDVGAGLINDLVARSRTG